MTNTGLIDEKPKNPSAFPHGEHQQQCQPEYGMTLRDYFAAKAMQAEVSVLGGMEGVDWDHHAACAYEVADAMLKMRK